VAAVSSQLLGKGEEEKCRTT